MPMVRTDRSDALTFVQVNLITTVIIETEEGMERFQKPCFFAFHDSIDLTRVPSIPFYLTKIKKEQLRI
jgi:hypothetical protein